VLGIGIGADFGGSFFGAGGSGAFSEGGVFGNGGGKPDINSKFGSNTELVPSDFIDHRLV
jgi:hypothetical protein